ncbi:MAG TPA: hypothetical protein DDY43_04895 [Synechococcales bacterium UBA10510]|nr:hypothetical protein [Synechococcales bacterium UBA10510]
MAAGKVRGKSLCPPTSAHGAGIRLSLRLGRCCCRGGGRDGGGYRSGRSGSGRFGSGNGGGRGGSGYGNAGRPAS